MALIAFLARFGSGQLAASPDQQLKEILNPIVFPHVHADHGLDLALERIGSNQTDILPVVNRGDVCKLEGIVMLRDVLHAYRITSQDSA